MPAKKNNYENFNLVDRGNCSGINPISWICYQLDIHEKSLIRVGSDYTWVLCMAGRFIAAIIAEEALIETTTSIKPRGFSAGFLLQSFFFIKKI